MKELEEYRAQIDAVDEELMNCLAKRFEIVRAVGRLKAEKKIEVVQSRRAETVVKNAEDRARAKNVDVELIRNFYLAMIDVAHVIEHKIQDEYDRA